MEKKMKIPMSKPDIGLNERKNVLDVFESEWFSQGKITQKFESKLSNFLSSNVAVVNNGTSALICALLAHGIKAGDSIVVPSFTFIATASAAKMLGIKIIPVDVELDTLNMDLKKLEQVVKNKKIKAVIVVDVAGLPIDIEAFEKLAKRYKFSLIEDAAEAFGSEYKKKKIGSFKHTTIFSFHIAKIITTIEGGCISGNIKIIKKIKQLRDHGSSINQKYVHEYLGSNFRITDLQSAIGIEQLKKINKYILRRNKIVDKYKQGLVDLEFQKIPEYVSKHSHMLVFALAKNSKERDRIIKISNKMGIDCRKAWLPIQNQPCFKELSHIKCENATDIFNRAFTIPIYNSMTNEEVEYVIYTLNQK